MSDKYPTKYVPKTLAEQKALARRLRITGENKRRSLEARKPGEFISGQKAERSKTPIIRKPKGGAHRG